MVKPICRDIVGCEFGSFLGGYIYPYDGKPQGAFLVKKAVGGEVFEGNDLYIDASQKICTSPNLVWYTDKFQAKSVYFDRHAENCTAQ